MSKLPALAALAALRAQPWAILPEYLRAAEEILLRAGDTEALRELAADGHAERHQDLLAALPALGTRLEGAPRATIRDGVAIVPIIGVIAPRATLMSISTGGTSLDQLGQDLRAAVASADVREILLLVDSPGGYSSGIAEAAQAIATAGKPITAYGQGLVASAAYWLASQAAEIVVDPTAALGSIGVIMSMQKQVGPGQDGMMSYDIVSSGAPNKRPDPATPEGRASLVALVDALEAEFISAVAAGRKVSAETVRQNFGQGGTLAGRAAVAAGMADQVGSLEATITRLSQRARPTTTTRKGDRPMAEEQTPGPATAAPTATPPAAGIPDAVAAERGRVAAIIAGTKPGFGALAQLAVTKGWSAEDFTAAQDASAPAQVAAAAAQFRASLPAPVPTAPATAPAPQTAEEKLRAAWDADEALQAEFGGNFALFQSYEANKGRVRHIRRA